MIYAKLYCEALTDPKLLMVGPEGFTLYVKGLLYAKQHLTDGRVPKAALALVGIGIQNPEQVAQLLVGSGLWVEEDGGYAVGCQRWAKRQQTKEQVEHDREQARLRKAKSRTVSRQCHTVTPPDVTPTEIEKERDIYKYISKGESRFSPPSVVEVAAYLKEQGAPVSEAEKFCNYHESRGWVVGKNPMKSWKAAVRTWIGNLRPTRSDTCTPMTEEELERLTS